MKFKTMDQRDANTLTHHIDGFGKTAVIPLLKHGIAAVMR